MVMFTTVSPSIVADIWLRFGKYLLNEWKPSSECILLFPLYREKKNEVQERMYLGSETSSGGYGHLVFCVLLWWPKASIITFVITQLIKHPLVQGVVLSRGERNEIGPRPAPCPATPCPCVVYIGKMIKCPFKQISEAQVDYLQFASVFLEVVLIRVLEQNLDCIFFLNSFSFPLVMYSFLSM